MGVTAHHEPDPCAHEVDREIVHVVENVDPNRAHGQRSGLRKPPSPAVAVVVAAHSDDRRDFAQRDEHVRRSHIAGVNDQVTGGERAERFVSYQAVRIGDHA